MQGKLVPKTTQDLPKSVKIKALKLLRTFFVEHHQNIFCSNQHLQVFYDIFSCFYFLVLVFPAANLAVRHWCKAM